jgi:hypothetical protein
MLTFFLFRFPLLPIWTPLGYYLRLPQWGEVWGRERSERRGRLSPRNRYARHWIVGLNTDNLRASWREGRDHRKPLSLYRGAFSFADVSEWDSAPWKQNYEVPLPQTLFLRKTSTVTSCVMSLFVKSILHECVKLGYNWELRYTSNEYNIYFLFISGFYLIMQFLGFYRHVLNVGTVISLEKLLHTEESRCLRTSQIF